ncbi:MAG TPA: penicillin-binding transpeptidase domain-containing protein [Longimicrobiaceae bacterium]|nr:penicillin-binding transpeptidase domain-containing protein [Longimicrobiaceae bacterium]
MADTLLNLLLRGVVLLFGVGAGLALLRWLKTFFRERREKWAQRIAGAMIVLAAVYAVGHARLLLQRKQIEAGRLAYSRFGDPRLAERNRAELRGWIHDCTGADANALARYGVADGEVSRVYPLGEAGANLIGGGDGAERRDYTVERLFTRRLRQPMSFGEAGELHPAGTDLPLTLCAAPTRAAWSLLEQVGRPGAIVVQDVRTGALVGYAATGRAEDAPYGIKRYAIPGSVFKLAWAALWWEAGFADEVWPCPPEIQAGPRAIRNFESNSYPSLPVPHGMLMVSCNTQSIRMALELRERLGAQGVADGFRRLGFQPYSSQAPRAEPGFWNTGSEAWAERMTPPPARIRLKDRFDIFEYAQSGIGQGPVDVTPLAISRFVQAIGNGGVMLPVTLEEERLDDLPPGQPVMRPETSQKLQRAMLAVVDSGSGRRAGPILEGTGWDLGGKTGTADVYRGRNPDGWFAGLMYGPDRRPRYTVVVYVQGGGQGGRVAAPMAAAMTRFMAEQEARAAAAAAAAAAPAAAPGGR